MWNFSDLAKQAQELTEKASVSTGLFNLDAMQGNSEPERPAAAPKPSVPAPAPLVSPSIFNLNALQSDGALLFGSPAPAPVVASARAQVSTSIFGTPDAKSPSIFETPEPSHKQHKPLVTTMPAAAATPKSKQPTPKMTIPNVQSSSPSPWKAQIPAVVESKPNGSNDWDNDWDFDEQIVVDDMEETKLHKEDNTNESDVPTQVQQEENILLHVPSSSPPPPNSTTTVTTTITAPVSLGMEKPNVMNEELLPNGADKLQPQDDKSVDFQPEVLLHADEDIPKEPATLEDIPQEWKKDDLDDMYDDEDDDNDDDDDESNEIEEQDSSKPAVEEPSNIDLSVTAPTETATNATADATEELVQLVEHEPNDALASEEEVVMDSNAPDMNGQDVATEEVIQSESNSSEFLVDSKGMSEQTQDDNEVMTTIHDSAMKEDVHLLVESTDSLEDEIAGVLDDRSNPEEGTPADGVDDECIPVDVKYDANDDPFGFSQTLENKVATNDELVASGDPLPTLGLENAPANESSLVSPMSLAVNSQVDETEEQPEGAPPSSIFEEPGVESDKSVVAPVMEPIQQTEPSEKMISASVLDRFTDQMHRLEENHHNEILDLQRQHEQQLQDLRNSINHDQCEAQRTELERNFLNRLKEKDEQLQEIMRINEGMELKLDVLKREVTGTKKLLEERESAIGSSSAAHDRAKQLLQEKLRKLEENAGTTQADVAQLQAQLQQTRDELEESNEAYAALKGRVKTVATELKERRGECRTLAVANVELTEVNEQLTTKLTSLQAQLDDRDRSEVEKGEERDSLRDKIKALEEELQEAEKNIKERDAVGEKALAAYKKKAQNSLAVANARAASAMQAKEEAELEARAARSTADLALERARKAELKGDESLAEAKSYVKDMESQMAEIEGRAKKAINSFSELQAQLQEAIAEKDAARTAREKMAKEVATLNRDLQQERNQTSELQQECADLQKRSNDLYEEVETLREELRKTATAAFMAQSNDVSGTESNGGVDRQGRHLSVNGPEKPESESTILMLQRELQDANQAIKELKETLRATLENQDDNGNMTGSVRRGPVDNASTNPGGTNDSTPLFYAMEKQAELNQARDEINRLANLLGELQSEKMQAYEAVESMKRERAAAEARLARYEKLGTAGGSKRHNSTRIAKASTHGGGYGSHPVVRRQPDSDAMSVGSVDSIDDLDGPTAESSQINLEYLKNVMLSYLNAKTLNERKRLVPAVSAVLCLTAEETAAAMKSVQESGSVESVGVSFFEGLKLM